MPLSKEEKDQLEALRAKESEPPERSERISIDFFYDPDDLASVKKGLSRGHLTPDDAKAWGYSEKELGLGEEEGGEEEGNGDSVKPKRRGGYFKEGS